MQYTTLAALANPVRLKLLCCLAKGRKNVEELIDTCGLAQSAVSQHLIKLKNAKLVKDEKIGKYVFYSLVYKKSARLAKQINDFIQEMDYENKKS